MMVFTMATSVLIAQEQTFHMKMDPAEFHEQIQDGEVQLIDVRTPEEFAEGHIEGAKNINFHSNDFLSQFSKLDRNKPLYIYCKSGNRSGKAAKELSGMGFKKIIDLKGGYLAWKEYTEK